MSDSDAPVKSSKIYAFGVQYQFSQVNKGASAGFTVKAKESYTQNLILTYARQGGTLYTVNLSIWGSTLYTSSYSTNDLSISFSGTSGGGGTLTVSVPNINGAPSFIYCSLFA